jgi:hypothetical protein
MSDAKASSTVRVGTTRTVLVVWASTCSATGMMFLLFGRITTSWAGTRSTASRSWAVDGFIVWPPTTRPRTPKERKIFITPRPVATATTAVGTGSESSITTSLVPSRTQASSSTCSCRSVTRISRGRPTSMAASMAPPMSSVWMWQFQMPSPPTTTIESPMAAHAALNPSIHASGASRKYMTS